MLTVVSSHDPTPKGIGDLVVRTNNTSKLGLSSHDPTPKGIGDPWRLSWPSPWPPCPHTTPRRKALETRPEALNPLMCGQSSHDPTPKGIGDVTVQRVRSASSYCPHTTPRRKALETPAGDDGFALFGRVLTRPHAERHWRRVKAPPSNWLTASPHTTPRRKALETLPLFALFIRDGGGPHTTPRRKALETRVRSPQSPTLRARPHTTPRRKALETNRLTVATGHLARSSHDPTPKGIGDRV